VSDYGRLEHVFVPCRRRDYATYVTNFLPSKW